MTEGVPATDTAFRSEDLTVHGQVLLMVVEGLLGRTEVAVPPGISVAGVALALDSAVFRKTLARLLATHAVRWLDARLQAFPPERVREDGALDRDTLLWDPTIWDAMPQGLNADTLTLVATLALASAWIVARQELAFPKVSEAGKHLQRLEEALVREQTRELPPPERRRLSTALIQAAGKGMEAFARLRFADICHSPGIPGPMDLVARHLLITAAARARLPAIKPRSMPQGWFAMLAGLADSSPLTHLYQVRSVTAGDPDSDGHGPDWAERYAPLFLAGNHHLLRDLEADLVEAWLTHERECRSTPASNRNLEVTPWAASLVGFIETAHTHGRYSVLVPLARFYRRFFESVSESDWATRVRSGISDFRRLGDRQRFLDTEMRFFQPLIRLSELLAELRRLPYAERSAEAEFLVTHPAGDLRDAVVSASVCRDRASPGGIASRPAVADPPGNP